MLILQKTCFWPYILSYGNIKYTVACSLTRRLFLFLFLFFVLKLRSLSGPSEIAQNEDILRMFLMACSVKSVKLSVIGLSCLQKLISHDAVASSALKEILATLKDVSSFLLTYFLIHKHPTHSILINLQIKPILYYLLSVMPLRNRT